MRRYTLFMQFGSEKTREYYDALLERDSRYDGIFVVGITSTGIFCRPICPARKPKFENCEFFEEPQAAMLVGFRACKRCNPASPTGEAPEYVRHLCDLVDKDPIKRWKDTDVRALGYDASTIRRQFQKYFGMSFIAYARAKRLGMAFNAIKKGEKVINTQIDSGYESGSGFRDAFYKIMGSAPMAPNKAPLLADWIETPLGAMMAFADDQALHLLEFTDRRGLEKEIERIRQKKIAIIPGKNSILEQTRKELLEYFEGKRKDFTVPLKIYGSAFQKSVMDVLVSIPCGETRSYADQAKAIGNPKAVRAVARANGANQIAIIIPCHRVIGSDGSLTGYAGGLPRKEWLLSHEKKYSD